MPFAAGTYTDSSQVVREFFQNDAGWDTVFERLEAVRVDLLAKAARCPTPEHDRRAGSLEGFEYAVATLRDMKKRLSRKESDARSGIQNT